MAMRSPIAAGRGARLGDGDQLVAVANDDQRARAAAEPVGVVNDGVVDRREVEPRSADRIEHLAHRRLSLQRLPQFGVALLDLAQQARVLDCDGRLVGEGLQEGNLGAGVATSHRSVHDDAAHRHTVTQHRDAHQLNADRTRHGRGGKLIGRAVVPVVDGDRLAGEDGGAAERSVVEPAPLPRVPPVRAGGRPGGLAARPLHLVAVPQRHDARPAVAQAARMLGDPVEHRLQIESRRADRIEDLGHRPLTRQRLIEVVEQPRVRDGDRRLLGEDLGDAPVARLEGAHLGAGQVQPSVWPIVDDQGRHQAASDFRRYTRQDGRQIVDEADVGPPVLLW